MAEIDLLKNYPKAKRNLDERLDGKTPQIREIARRFGRDFFDGERKYGYGGYHYDPKYWQHVIPDFQKRYHLTGKSSILDVGCGKGFMLYDYKRLIPGITVTGLDISTYALENALPGIKPHLVIGNAKKLPFASKSFDLVISINTVHNLPEKECSQALSEIMRVTRKHAFITVDAYETQEEKKRMMAWNLTARTILSIDGWKKFFRKASYGGDYYWFTP